MTTPQMDWLDDQRRRGVFGRPIVADDIVKRLRHAEDNGICEWQVLIDAADEIERLRAAGDALAEALHAWINGMDAFANDRSRIQAWQEARRG